MYLCPLHYGRDLLNVAVGSDVYENVLVRLLEIEMLLIQITVGIYVMM